MQKYLQNLWTDLFYNIWIKGEEACHHFRPLLYVRIEWVMFHQSLPPRCLKRASGIHSLLNVCSICDYDSGLPVHTPASLHLFFLFLHTPGSSTLTWLHEVTHMRTLEIKHVHCSLLSFQNALFLGPDTSPPSINQQTLHTVKLWRGMNNDDPKDENSLKVQIIMFLLLQLIL